jgi:WD40 repeat protein
LLFDKTNRYLFSGSDDKTLIAWDLATGKSFRKIDIGFAVNSIAQTVDTRFIYVAGANPQIRLYNLTNNQIAKAFDGHADAVNCISISNNNKYLISGSNDKTARIWDVVSGKQIRILPVDCWKVTAVAFSNDSKYAITGCNDGSIKIWEVETGKLVSKVEANGEYVKDAVFTNNKLHVIVAANLKNSVEFGARVWPTGIEPPKAIITPSVTDSTINQIDTTKVKTNSTSKPLPTKK